jgi:hypothetical protein
MIEIKPPKIDPRRFEDIEGILKGLVPHYTPEWRISDNDPGLALLKIFTHLTEGIISRMNQVPQKNLIAFLDMLGIKQLPAQSSRVPVTFMLTKGIQTEILVPERTQVSADKTSEHKELIFEIEKNLTASPAQLLEVYGMDPVKDRIYKPPQDFLNLEEKKQGSMTYTIVSLASKDTKAFQLDHVTDLKEKDLLKILDTEKIEDIEKIEYVEISKLTATIVTTKDKLEFDHSPDIKVEKISKFNLLEGKNLQEHILYIAHKDLFNIKGKAQFNLYVTLHPGTGTAASSLEYSWEYWGKAKNDSDEEIEDWHEFKMIDDTQGFTRDGEINLVKLKEGEITEKEIKLAEGEEDEGAIKSRWIRCKLKDPLGSDVVRRLPKLDNIKFTVESKGENLLPDLAYNNDTPLDVSKPFLPLGKEPRIFDNFAIGSKEVFSKKGGTIKLNVKLDPGISLGQPTAILYEDYLFTWKETSTSGSSQTIGEDDQKLREVLIQKYSVDWVKKAKIINETNKITLITDDKLNSISIDVVNNIATISINEFRIDEFIVKPPTNKIREIYDNKIRVFFGGTLGKFVEIQINPQDKSEWIDHGFPPDTNVTAGSTPSAVVYDDPLHESISIFITGENGHLIERSFNNTKRKWEWIDWQSPRQYLFDWNKIPGGDEKILKEFLKLNYGIDPATIIRIEKCDDNSSIKISTRTITALLKLSGNSVKLEISDGRTDEFDAREQNGQLNIYSKKINVLVNSDPAAINDTLISVFVIASDNYLYEFNKDNGNWKCHPHKNNQTFDSSPFAVIDYSVYTDIIPEGPKVKKNARTQKKAIVNGNIGNIAWVFLKGQNGQLFQLKCKLGYDGKDNETWIPVAPIPEGVKVSSKPFAWSDVATGSILAYIIGDDNRLWEYKEDEDVWNVKNREDGVLFDSNPHGSIFDPYQSQYLAAPRVRQATIKATSVASSSQRKPRSTAAVEKNIHIFLKGLDNSLYEYYSNGDNSIWVDHPMPIKLKNSPFILNVYNTSLVIFSDTIRNTILERSVLLELYDGLKQPVITLPASAGLWTDHKDPYEQILTPSLHWEYHNDTGWVVIKELKDETSNLLTDGIIRFKMPDDIVTTTIAGQENYWIRARLIGGNYGEVIFIQKKEFSSSPVKDTPEQLLDFTKTAFKPPICSSITMDYSLEEKKLPEKSLAYNNLNYRDETEASKITGKYFEPFIQMEEDQLEPDNPSIYLGFDKILRGGPLRIFFSQKELPFTDENKPIMNWSYFSKDRTWTELKGYSDDTEGLIKSGILEFAGPPDISGRKIAAKYLFWIKGSLTRGNYEENPLIEGIYPNTTYAIQAETIRDEILGSSSGLPDQVFSFLMVPVLEGETIRVREFITDEEAQDIDNNLQKDEKLKVTGEVPVLEVKDQTGKIIERWVLWSEVRNFFDSKGTDRHYTLDRATGKIEFGNGTNGLIPLVGENNIKAFLYQTGGGSEGNIKEREIKSLKSALAGIDKVFNPAVADGGAIAATLDQMLQTGPAMISHRNRAVTAEDFEWLAKKASRKVAKVKCLSNTNNRINADKLHLKETGWVTVIIVPDEQIPSPIPSLELKRQVRQYLEGHCANIISNPGHVWVDGPTYIEISVSLDVFVTSIDLISVVERQVRTKLDEFFHPLTGGPEGRGWDFGRDINVSDIYRLLQEIEGIDHVENLRLDYNGPGKKFLFCWNEIQESDNTGFIEYLVKNFDADWLNNATIISSDELKSSLFSWDEFLENDSRLKEFIIQDFNENWVNEATIDRSVGNIILFSDAKNCLSLRLNIEGTRIKAIINNSRTEEFIVKNENGKLIIKTRTIKFSDGEDSLFMRLNDDETRVKMILNDSSILNDGRTDEFIVRNENGRFNIYSQDIVEIQPDFLVTNGKHTINTQFVKGE